MEKVLTKAVISQKVDGISMENYLARLLERVERDEIEIQKSNAIVSVSRQLNNRHKNIINAFNAEQRADR